jgi:hypothetical protein
LTIEQKLRELYGVIIENGNLEWSVRNISIAFGAVEDIANRFGAASIFRAKFNSSASSPIRMIMGTSTFYNPEIIAGECTTITGGGCTSPNKVINFVSLFPYRDESARNNIVHELGHVFSNEHGGVPETELGSHPRNFVANRHLILKDNSTIQWQLNTSPNQKETFADFFVAWTYDAWQPLTDEYGTTIAGIAKEWMDDKMQDW